MFKPIPIRGKLAKRDLVDSGTIPVYSSDTDNNGVVGFVNKDASYKITKDLQVYLVFGDHTRSMNIATTDFCVMDNVKVLIPVTKKVHAIQFIATMWRKNIPDLGYARHWSIARDLTFKLPITDNGEPDYDFMDSFMQGIEIEHVRNIENYLVAENLNGLTKDEEEAIRSYDNVEWKEFQIGRLFKKIRTKKLPYKAKELPKEPVGENILPCLTSSFMNQGLNYYAPKVDATILRNVISLPSNSDVYRAYFQSQDFTVLSDAYAIKWTLGDEGLTNNQYLFAVACINEVTDLPIYSYKNKLGGWNVVKEKYISLPVKGDEPDYEFMELLISTLKKLSIKDTVEWVSTKKAFYGL